jgi:hypothetical protein
MTYTIYLCIYRLFQISGRNSRQYSLLSVFSLKLQGFFDALAYSLTPAVSKKWKDFIRSRVPSWCLPENNEENADLSALSTSAPIWSKRHSSIRSSRLAEPLNMEKPPHHSSSAHSSTPSSRRRDPLTSSSKGSSFFSAYGSWSAGDE